MALPLLAAIASIAQAQTPSQTHEPTSLIQAPTPMAQNAADGRWHGGVSIGGSASSGNTKATTVTLNADAAKVTDRDRLWLYSIANYADSETARGVKTRTAQLFRLGGRYDYNLNPRVFLFTGGEVETNDPGGIDRRYNVNAGSGYHLISNPDTTFDVFGGVGYASTDFTTGQTRNGAELLVGEESTHRLGDANTFKQRLVYYPGTSELGNRATFDASLATTITGAWTLNTGVAVRYASRVAPGLKNTDSLLTVGFGYKF